MFICKMCKEQTAERQPVNRIVTKHRQRTYEKPIRKRKRGKIVGYELVTGWEIVEELEVCPTCYAKHTNQAPRLQRAPKQRSKKPQGFNRKRSRRSR